MTETDYDNWLRSPSSIKCILVEVKVNNGSETTFYLSDKGYTTSPTDSPANTAYLPIIKGGLGVSSSLPLDGSPSLSWGDIEIDNTQADRDDWLFYTWKNKQVQVFLGDVSWPRSDFKLVFQGKVDDLSSNARDTLFLSIRDKMNDLNNSVSEVILGGTTTQKDSLIPLCFGEVHNVEPLLIDPVLLKYQVHNGAIERIIEVRDNGVPVSFTATLGSGTFVLANSPVGTITCSVQGAKFSGSYYNTAGDLTYHIIKTYGLNPLTDSDIDLSNFISFISAHPQPVGIYLSDKTNILSVVSELLSSVGASLTVNPEGKFQIQKINLPSVSYAHTVSKKDMKEKSFRVATKEQVQAAIVLRYCKNYLVQENLQSGLPAEHLALYAKEWLEAKVSDSVVASNFSVSTTVEPQETALLVTTDASTEATRRLNLYKVQRYSYSFSTDLSKLRMNVGDYVQVTQDRFGFTTPKVCQIISKNIDWFNNNIEFEVLT